MMFAREPAESTMTRFACLLLGAALVFGAVDVARAQNWPAKPVRLIVPNAPGSSPDLLSRMWADKLTRALGHQVVVENNIAGSGLVAAQTAARAAPDGYTFFLATVVTHATNPFMYKSLPYDPVRDFSPVAILMDDGPFIVAVNPAVPAANFAEFLALAKSRPGKLSFAADAGIAGIAGRWLFKVAGAEVVHVPYKQIAPSLQDVVGGRIEAIIISLAAADAFVKSGKLRLIGVTSSRRFPGVEHVPAITETVPEVQFGGWFTIAAPAGTPVDIIQRVNRETAEFLKQPEVDARIRSFGWFSNGAGTPQSTAEFIRGEREKWGRIIREVGIQPE
jgi:tripartite-type tricarboxylate transporter receptor subunit TctC